MDFLGWDQVQKETTWRVPDCSHLEERWAVLDIGPGRRRRTSGAREASGIGIGGCQRRTNGGLWMSEED